MNPINEVILSSLPDILFTIFPPRCASSGEMLYPTLINSLSMDEQAEASKSHPKYANASYSNNVKDFIGMHGSVGLENVIDTGKKFINKYVKRTTFNKKWAFMELVRSLAYLFDPHREESIASICLKEGLTI